MARISPWLLAASITLTACSGSSEDKATDEATDEGKTDGTGGTGFVGIPYWEPAAVGFELDAIIHEDGSLGSYFIDGEEQFPSVTLTFAAAEFFSASSEEEQANLSCTAFGTFTAQDGSPLATNTGVQPWHNYDSVINIEFHTCADAVDPAFWGNEAVDLYGPFVGAHIGIGLGPATTYLTDAYDFEDPVLNNARFTQYIAINSLNGSFVAEDWTLGLFFEFDESNQELVVDDEGLLSGIDISALEEGDSLPLGYARGINYWYQDFPLIDFTNLRDGAPTGSTPTTTTETGDTAPPSTTETGETGTTTTPSTTETGETGTTTTTTTETGDTSTN